MQLSISEKKQYAAWQETMACNAAFFRAVARYLNDFPRLVTPALIRELTGECQVSEQEAFCAVLCAALDIDEERSAREACLAREYMPRAVRALDPAIYRADPYFQNIRVPHKTVGEWKFTRETYAPYEGFVCGSLLTDSGFRAIPPIGYFTEEFSFPAVMQNGVEWMAIKPNEIETMRAPIAAAHGRVLAMGLGLGYYAYMTSRKPQVSHVTVVERDPAVIRLFREELLPQFEQGSKIEIICADALDFAEKALPSGGYDTVFADLWHDAGDGLPLYARLRGIEERNASPRFDYWIEDMLLSHLRSMVFAEIDAGKTPFLGFDAMRAALSDHGLRALAPGFSSEIAKNT